MDSMSMDNSTSSSNSSITMTMEMIPYLHFSVGDYLFFKSIAPSSGGAIFGACFVLFLFSILGRWLHAMRRGLERRFAVRAANLSVYNPDDDSTSTDSKGSSKSGTSATGAAPCCEVRESSRFILSHELSRGAMTGFDVTLHYMIMLAIMTFNASYMISIITGAVVGEIAFGRLH